MKIKQLVIKNFRSLKEINMQNLQNLIILIGENASGKTNILEATDLFFNSFDYPYEQNKGTLTRDNWYLWFEGNTVEAIELQVILGELNGTQRKKLAEVANIKQEKGDLVINRSIVSKNDNLVYRNDLIQWGSVVIRRSDTGYSVEGGIEFEPNSFVQTVNDNILKNAFSYIPLSRGTELRTPHGSILASEVRQELVKKGEDITPRGMQEWNRIRQTYSDRGWTPGQLECRGGQLLIPRGTTPIPYELEGSGYQAILNLLRQIEMKGQIVAIEEPENHLHPYLQRIFVKAVRQLPGTKKQVFVSTQSPFIIDLVNLSSVWSVYKDGLESKVQNVSTVKGISDILWRLGVRPSDFLFANGVLIVEGPTDREIYTDWARKIDKPFDAVGIYVIDSEGAGNIKNYLKSEIVRRTSFRSYSLCDKNAETQLRKAVQGIVPPKNMFTLDRGDLEDYYSRTLVQEFAKETAIKKGKQVEEIPDKIKEGETVETLDKLLGGDWWKTQLASKVKQGMQVWEIDEEIKRKLTQIYDSVEKEVS